MIYEYDGSFMGFLTVIFQGYKHLLDCKIEPETDQMVMDFDQVRISTNMEEAKRVEKGIKERFSPSFFHSISVAFRSHEEEKEETIARTIRKMYAYGENFLYSSDGDAAKFLGLERNVYREVHTYMGLLRFQEIQEGYFYAPFRPKNQILDLLFPHFVHRLPKEKFMIHDVGREICGIYEDGQKDFFLVEDLHIQGTEEEEFYQKAWQTFYDHIAIEARKNPKRMMGHMPKFRWEFLPERK